MNDEKRDMFFRDKDDNYRRPKKVEGSRVGTSNANRKNRRLSYMSTDYYYDQDVRTGICFICKREGWAQKSKTTILHHLKYENSDPLAWTIEICSRCHWQIDDFNKKKVSETYGGKSNPKYDRYGGKYYR